MKLKGISVFEQHVEKGVLGLMGVGLLGVLGLQFATQPNKVKVGNETVPPGRAFEPIKSQAEALLAAANEPTPRDLPEVAPLTLNQRLRLGQASIPEGPAVALGAPLALANVTGVRQLAAGQYAFPSIPAVAGLAARAHHATINPAEVVRTPELAALLPAQQPFDKASVSIEAVFNGTALRAALQADPDAEGPLEALPLSWWQDVTGIGGPTVDILAVEVERETLRTPAGDTPPEGSTRVVVPAIPGRPNAVQTWTQSVRSPGDAPMVLADLRPISDFIQRPPFLSTIAGPAWSPPSEAGPDGDVDRAQRVAELRAELTRLTQQITELEGRVVAAGGRVRPETPEERAQRLQREREARRQQSGSDPRGGGGAGGGGGGGQPGRGGAPQPPGRGGEGPRGGGDSPDANQPNVNALLGQYRNRVNRRDSVVRQLTALGETVSLNAADDPAAAPTGTTVGPVAALLENDEVRLWAHDLTAEPGALYRYRMRVVINNPLFGRSLQESQAGLAQPATIPGPWSEWSQPVAVDRHDYFFVTSAEPVSTLTGRPRATVEMYSFFYGFYRVATVSVEPGDLVFAQARLPELFTADMAALREAVQSGRELAAVPALPSGPRPGPVSPPPGMRPDEIQPPPGLRGTPSHDDRRGAAPGTGPGTTAPDPAVVRPPWLSQPVPREKQLVVDAMLLDIAVDPTTGTSPTNPERMSVILRDQAGRLAVRVPARDQRDEELYRRLSASERLGQTQGIVPTPVVEPTRPNVPVPTRPDEGGGGGGG